MAGVSIFTFTSPGVLSNVSGGSSVIVAGIPVVHAVPYTSAVRRVPPGTRRSIVSTGAFGPRWHTFGTVSAISVPPTGDLSGCGGPGEPVVI